MVAYEYEQYPYCKSRSSILYGWLKLQTTLEKILNQGASMKDFSVVVVLIVRDLRRKKIKIKWKEDVLPLS